MMNEFDKSNIDYKKIIMIIVAILIIVGGVIFVSIVFLGGREDRPRTTRNNNDTNDTGETTSGPPLNITSTEVRNLYMRVSSCNSGVPFRNADYFYVNEDVHVHTMDTFAKARCAFQFISEENITRNNDEYFLLASVFDEAFTKMFGSESSINVEEITGDELKIFMNRSNTDLEFATVNYDSSLGLFRLRFTNERPPATLLPNFTSALISANSFDNGIVLREKIVYVRDLSEGNNFGYEVFSDPNHRNRIGGRRNIPQEELRIDLADYFNEASVITYVFKRDFNGNYFFYSSTIN